MLSHELATLLLANPNLPIATYALGHTYMSGIDQYAHGPLKLGILETYGGQHIVVGDIPRKKINYPNWWISSAIYGDIHD